MKSFRGHRKLRVFHAIALFCVGLVGLLVGCANTAVLDDSNKTEPITYSSYFIESGKSDRSGNVTIRRDLSGSQYYLGYDISHETWSRLGLDYDDKFIIAVDKSYTPIIVYMNKDAQHVTYDEIIKFIKYDKTNEREYIVGEFECLQFATTLHDNAERYGIHNEVCAVFAMDSNNNPVYHACNRFYATDKQMYVYFDCTGNKKGVIGYADTQVSISDKGEYTRTWIWDNTEKFYFGKCIDIIPMRLMR